MIHRKKCPNTKTDQWVPPHQVRTPFRWSMQLLKSVFQSVITVGGCRTRGNLVHRIDVATRRAIKLPQILFAYMPRKSCHNFECCLQGHPPSKACSNTSSIRLANKICQNVELKSINIFNIHACMFWTLKHCKEELVQHLIINRKELRRDGKSKSGSVHSQTFPNYCLP